MSVSSMGTGSSRSLCVNGSWGAGPYLRQDGVRLRSDTMSSQKSFALLRVSKAIHEEAIPFF